MVLLFGGLNGFADQPEKDMAAMLELHSDSLPIPPELKDSASLAVQSPSRGREENVFSDSKLSYKQEVEREPDSFNRFLRWLTGKLFNKVGAESMSQTRSLLIWTLVIISLVVIVRMLLRSQLVGLTRQAPKATAFSFSDISEDLDSVNFDKKVAEALADNDYRLATRWLYLKTLYVLDKSQHIVFAPYKTNIDYRYELKNKGLLANFIRLSRIYEYVWYGQFVIDEAHYRGQEQEFKDFERTVNV